MTTPTERTRAVQQLGKAVQDLSRYSHGKGERALVPREELRTLLAWLRHYPTDGELWLSSQALPSIWSNPD